jgi:hypothetical protein
MFESWRKSSSSKGRSQELDWDAFEDLNCVLSLDGRLSARYHGLTLLARHMSR